MGIRQNPLYALWVLILVLGMRKGEALGLIWPVIDIDKAQVSLEWQLQRVGRQLIHKHYTKTDGSTDMLPLPAICLAALKLQKDAQDRMRTRFQATAGPSRQWPTGDLVFTTRTGRPIEPRAINRRFDARCAKAGVRRIRVHDTRRTCGHYWPRSTCILESRCRFFGTHASRSRWRSTPRFLMRSHVPRLSV